MLFSSISSFHSTFSNLDVQPTISSDVQSVHLYDATVPTSSFTVTATTSNTTGTSTVHTVLPYSAMPDYSLATVILSSIYGPCFTTTSTHSGFTHWLYQGVWIRSQ